MISTIRIRLGGLRRRGTLRGGIASQGLARISYMYLLPICTTTYSSRVYYIYMLVNRRTCMPPNAITNLASQPPSNEQLDLRTPLLNPSHIILLPPLRLMITQRPLGVNRLDSKRRRNLDTRQRRPPLSRLLEEPLILKLHPTLLETRPSNLQKQPRIPQTQTPVEPLPVLGVDRGHDEVVLEVGLDAEVRLGAEDAVRLEEQDAVGGLDLLPEPGGGYEALTAPLLERTVEGGRKRIWTRLDWRVRRKEREEGVCQVDSRVKRTTLQSGPRTVAKCRIRGTRLDGVWDSTIRLGAGIGRRRRGRRGMCVWGVGVAWHPCLRRW